MPTLPDQLLVRRTPAREFLGVEDDEFSKLVTAEVLPPVYLIWDVTDRKGRVLFQTTEVKARAYVQENANTRCRPAGRAYFRRSDVLRLADKPSPATNGHSDH